MVSFSSLTCLAISLVSLTAFTSASDQKCILANWYDEKDKLTSFDNIIDFGLSSDFLKSIDPVKLNDKEVVSTTVKILGSDYNLKVYLEKAHVKGVQHVNMKPVAITSKESLAVDINIGKNLHLAVDGHVSLNQITRPDCKEDEEKWGLWCYRKCSLFPGMPKDATRLSPQICKKSFWSWKFQGTPFKCNGFGVSSDKNAKGEYACPVRAKEQRTPKKLDISIQFGLDKPSIAMDTMMKVKMCSGDVEKEATKKACVDLTAGEFMVALALKKFDEFLPRALKRVEDIAVKKIDIDFDKITVNNIDLPQKGKFVNAVLDLFTGVIKKLLNKKKFVYEKITSAIEKMAISKINQYLDTNLKPNYGSTCYDRRFLRY